MFTDDQLDVIRATVVRAASGYMDHPDAALLARDAVKLLVSRETSGIADPAWSGYPLEPAVGMPTDERALADRQQTGCLLRRGELCPCPVAPFAYDGCERIKMVGE